jgi:hypothetical protein
MDYYNNANEMVIEKNIQIRSYWRTKGFTIYQVPAFIDCLYSFIVWLDAVIGYEREREREPKLQTLMSHLYCTLVCSFIFRIYVMIESIQSKRKIKRRK